MFVSFQIISLAMALSVVVAVLTALLPLKSMRETEKLSPFECGFSPFESSWQSFSIQFFLVSLIFLIFDVELILMFPLLPLASSNATLLPALVFWGFLVLLTFGYVYEWVTSQLEWFD